jgi:acyl-coenzyme A synthetase/AMP-(fatty) acid ligase
VSGSECLDDVCVDLFNRLTQPEILDWHMERSPDHIWTVYEKQDGSGGLNEITYRQFGRVVQRYSRTLTSIIGDRKATVSLLAAVDTLSYQAIMVCSLSGRISRFASQWYLTHLLVFHRASWLHSLSY